MLGFAGARASLQPILGDPTAVRSRLVGRRCPNIDKPRVLAGPDLRVADSVQA